MTLHQQVKVVARIVRRSFSVEDKTAVFVAFKIVEALNKPDTKVTEKGREDE